MTRSLSTAPKSKLVRFRSLLLIITFALLAWLSQRYTLQIDLTANAGNSLSEASQKLLTTLPEPVHVNAYIRRGLSLRLQIEQLIARNQRHKTNFQLHFFDPDLHPEQTRELDIGPEGLVIVEYQGHSEKLKFIDESSLTNALLQLANPEPRWLTFLTGHGERAADGQANFDLGRFSKELKRRNITAQPIDLNQIPAIPDNTSALIVTSPRAPFSNAEIAMIRQYVETGGNLMLLTDPDDQHLTFLEDIIGIHRLPGILLDNDNRLHSKKDPGFIVSELYHEHAITRDFKSITLFPVTAALSVNVNNPFSAKPLLNTSDDKQHSQTFAYALTRSLPSGNEQRIVVVGDGDFLSNAYLGNAGNLDMGMRMVSWLTHNDLFISVPAKTARDKNLQLTEMTVALIGFGFLVAIPVLLLTAGLIIWRRRKHY